MNLYPTKTRITLLRQIDQCWVVVDPISGESYVSYTVGGAGRTKVTIRVAELEQAGWIELPSGSDEPPGRPTWRLTELGQAVLKGGT